MQASRLVWLGAWLLSAFVSPVLADTSPRVVTSIKPVHLIVEAIGGDSLEARLLLPSAVSPHQYQLRPSDRQILAEADKVFWIGPEMERFLVKPLSLLPSGTSVPLISVPGIEGLSSTGGDHGGHGHAHHHNHDHAGDPHIWLNPDNAIVMATEVKEQLSQLNPSHRKQYEANLARFEAEVRRLDAQTRQQFSQIKPAGYLVLHEAYSHFESRYGLSHLLAATPNPERKPGARRLSAIQSLVDQGQVDCVFEEPQFSVASLENVLEGTGVTVIALDPLATEAASYSEFMREFGAAFYRCFEMTLSSKKQ